VQTASGLVLDTCTSGPGVSAPAKAPAASRRWERLPPQAPRCVV